MCVFPRSGSDYCTPSVICLCFCLQLWMPMPRDADTRRPDVPCIRRQVRRRWTWRTTPCARCWAKRLAEAQQQQP